MKPIDLQGDSDMHGGVGRRKLDGVRDQVYHDLLGPLPVEGDHRLLLQRIKIEFDFFYFGLVFHD